MIPSVKTIKLDVKPARPKSGWQGSIAIGTINKVYINI